MATDKFNSHDYYLMDELLTDEHKLIRETVRAWVKKEVSPVIEEAAQTATTPKTWIKGLAEIGAFGPTIPTEYGGAGLDHISYGLIMQELERGDSGLRSMASVQSSLVMYPIYTFGSEEQKRKYLPKLAKGENVVASSGTSLTVGQIKLIRRFTSNITILYDGDSAGIAASFRGIDLILEEGMNVKVLLFPDGDDPDSYSKRVSSEELKTFIKENSKNFVEFKTKILIADAGKDPAKRVVVINEIADSLSILPAMQSEQYITICSQLLYIDEQNLINLVNKKRRERSNNKRVEKNPVTVEEPILNVDETQPSIDEIATLINFSEHQERKIIELLINYGNENISVDSEDEEGNTIQVESSVAHLIIAELQNDFIVLDNVLYNNIYNEYVQQLEKNNIPDNKYFLNHEDMAISSLTIDLISTPYTLANWERHSIYTNLEDDDLKKSTLKAVYTLKSRRLEMMVREIEKKMKECGSDDEVIILQQTKYELDKTKISINAFLGRIVVK